MTARISPGTLRELGPLGFAFSRIAGKVTGTEPPAIFTTLGRTKGLYWGWMHFSARLMPFGTFKRRDAETIILWVAHLRGSDYEWSHHTMLGKRAGVTDADIAALESDDVDHFDDRMRTLLVAARELVTTKDLGDDTWRALEQHLDERRCVEFLLLVNQYDGLATTLHTLRITPDAAR